VGSAFLNRASGNCVVQPLGTVRLSSLRPSCSLVQRFKSNIIIQTGRGQPGVSWHAWRTPFHSFNPHFLSHVDVEPAPLGRENHRSLIQTISKLAWLRRGGLGACISRTCPSRAALQRRDVAGIPWPSQNLRRVTNFFVASSVVALVHNAFSLSLLDAVALAWSSRNGSNVSEPSAV
jgi:hypothetical protein